MIFLPCADAGAVDVLEVVRQKGELELEGRCQQLRGTARALVDSRAVLSSTARRVSTYAERSVGSDATVSYLAAMLWLWAMAMTAQKSTNRPGPFPGGTVSVLEQCFRLGLRTCCCFFIS